MLPGMKETKGDESNKSALYTDTWNCQRTKFTKLKNMGRLMYLWYKE